MNYDGFINLNKDKGYSSQYAVAAVKRLLHVKAGHCGTLDPQAEGVLPICLGKATRLSGLVMGRPKTYIGEICFGEATSSYDAAGDITDTAYASHLTAAMVEDVLPKFIGCLLYTSCLCDCGRQIEVRGTSLRNGTTRSCGCLRNELTRQRNSTRADITNNLIGQKYGLLTATELLPDRVNGQRVWRCQ